MIATLAIHPAIHAEARCRIEPTAAAWQRLEIWGREWTEAKGLITAHSSRHLAWVANRSGAVLETLVLVTVHGGDVTLKSWMGYERTLWVHCTGGVTSERNEDWTPNRY